jgi:hypothetical protein
VLDFFIAAITLAGLLRAQASALHHFFRKNMKHLIISSEKNEVPHYFFRKTCSTSLFLQKKMRRLIIS